jgi:hypothetical protein
MKDANMMTRGGELDSVGRSVEQFDSTTSDRAVPTQSTLSRCHSDNFFATLA